jgi:hypothetical protein
LGSWHQVRVGCDKAACRAACGDADGRHLRCPAGPERGDQTSASGGTTAPDPCCGECALFEAQRRYHRERQREHPALASDVLAELRTALALAQVLSQQSTPQLTGARGRELLADLGARDLTSAAVLDQGRAGETPDEQADDGRHDEAADNRDRNPLHNPRPYPPLAEI